MDMAPDLGPLKVKEVIIDKNDNAEGIVQFAKDALKVEGKLLFSLHFMNTNTYMQSKKNSETQSEIAVGYHFNECFIQNLFCAIKKFSNTACGVTV